MMDNYSFDGMDLSDTLPEPAKAKRESRREKVPIEFRNAVRARSEGRPHCYPLWIPDRRARGSRDASLRSRSSRRKAPRRARAR